MSFRTRVRGRVTRRVVGVLGIAIAVAALLSGVVPDVSEAQPPGRRGGPRVIQLDEIRIEGRVQKPNAFYILNRSNLGYEVLDLRTTFLREIVRTVQEEPF